jgi:hypothetical protein
MLLLEGMGRVSQPETSYKCFDKTKNGIKSEVYCVGSGEVERPKIQKERMKKKRKSLVYVKERDGGNGGKARYGIQLSGDIVGPMLICRGVLGVWDCRQP